MNGKIPWKRGGRVFVALLREFGLKVEDFDDETCALLVRVCGVVEVVLRMRLDRPERKGSRQSGATGVGRGCRPVDASDIHRWGNRRSLGGKNNGCKLIIRVPDNDGVPRAKEGGESS